jgi:hypothetical protein
LRRPSDVSFGDASASVPLANAPRDTVRAEIEIDLTAANDYVARHGSFATIAREHYESDDDASEREAYGR